jgi:hypothetical protein
MLAAGCTAEQIVAAVKADRGARSSGSVRQAEYRKRLKEKKDAERNAGDVTLRNSDVTSVTDRNETETVSLSPVPLLPPTPPNNPLTPNPIQKPNNTRGSRLPEDWTLTGPDLAFALSKGFSEAQTAEIFEKFTNYWWSATGSKATKRDWHKAWKVWVLNTRPQSRAGPQTFAKPLTEHQRKQHETREILDDLANFAAGRGGGGDQNPRLLRHDTGGGPESLRGGIGGDADDLSAQRHRASG